MRRDEPPDEPVLEAAPLGPHRVGALLLVLYAWDASDDARPGAMDAADLRREPWGVDAEKLAGPARDVRARGASFPLALQSALQARPLWAAELCIRDVARSAEQSCAALAAAAAQEVRPDEEELRVPEVQPMPKWKPVRALTAQRSRAEREQPRDVEAQLQTVQCELRQATQVELGREV